MTPIPTILPGIGDYGIKNILLNHVFALSYVNQMSAITVMFTILAILCCYRVSSIRMSSMIKNLHTNRQDITNNLLK